MAVQREEAVVELGLSTTKVEAGLKKFSTNFKQQIATLAQSWTTLAAGVGFGMVLAAFDKLTQRVDTIRRISDASGFGLGMVQDFLNAGKAAGIAESAIEKALDTFSQQLKPGDDPEVALANFADRLKEIADPAEQARLSTEAFGKAGAKLVTILKDGSAGVSKLAEDFGRLSDTEIANIEAADNAIDQAKSWGTVKLGQLIEGGKLWASALKNLFAGNAKPGPDAIADSLIAEVDQAYDEAQRKKAARAATARAKEKIEADNKAKEDEAAALKAAEKFAKTQRDLEFKNSDELGKIRILQEEIITANAERRLEIEYQIAALAQTVVDKQATMAKNLAAAGKNYDQSVIGEYLPTFDELAKTGIYKQDAQRLKWLQADTKDALLWGDKAAVTKNLTEIRDIKDKLEKAGVYVNPQTKMIEQMQEMLKLAKEEGILTQVVLGDTGNT